MMLLLLVAQAVAGPPVPPHLRPRPARPSAPCPVVGFADEIVVCASKPTDERLASTPPPAQPAEDPLSFRLPGGGKGNVRALQRTVGGFTGQGAAVTFTFPLGRKKK